MKLFFTISIGLIQFFTSIPPIFAQVLWDKDYPPGYCQQIVETGDGGYFVISDYTFVKISSIGDTIFTNKTAGILLDYPNHFQTCAYLQDGLVAIAITKLFTLPDSKLVIIDQFGRVINTKQYDGDNINDMVSSGRNLYLSLSENGKVWKFNSSLQEDVSWKDQAVQNLFKLHVNQNNNIVGMTGTGRFVELRGSSGEVLVSKQTFNNFDSEITKFKLNWSLYQVNNFYYLSFTGSEHAKISLTGDLVAFKTLFNRDRYRYGTSIPESSGFTFFYSYWNAELRWHLVKTDENYNTLDSISFDVRGGYKTSCVLLKDGAGKYMLGGKSDGGMRVMKYQWEQKVTNRIDANHTSNVVIYPNPASDNIVIHAPENYKNLTAEIYNSASSRVATLRISNNEAVSLSYLGLSPGIYLFKFFENNNYIYSAKVVVRY